MSLFNEGAAILQAEDIAHLTANTYELIVNLIKLLQHQPEITFLYPMRGSNKIATQLRLAFSNTKHVFLSTSGLGGLPKNSSMYKNIERKAIEDIAFSGFKSGTLAVIDTAQSGHGSKKLAELLNSIHDSLFSRELWEVKFILLHTRSEFPNAFHKMQSIQRSPGFSTTYCYIPCDTLPFENSENVVGFRINQKRELEPLEASIHYEKTIFSNDGKYLLFEAPAPQVVDVLVAAQLTEEMSTGEGWSLVNPYVSRSLLPPEATTPILGFNPAIRRERR